MCPSAVSEVLLIWDPAVLLCYSRTSGGRWHKAWAEKAKTERGGVTPCFLFRYRRYSTEENYFACAEGDFNIWMCISTVASLHGVGLKPLQTELPDIPSHPFNTLRHKHNITIQSYCITLTLKMT